MPSCDHYSWIHGLREHSLSYFTAPPCLMMESPLPRRTSPYGYIGAAPDSVSSLSFSWVQLSNAPSPRLRWRSDAIWCSFSRPRTLFPALSNDSTHFEVIPPTDYTPCSPSGVQPLPTGTRLHYWSERLQITFCQAVATIARVRHQRRQLPPAAEIWGLNNCAEPSSPI